MGCIAFIVVLWFILRLIIRYNFSFCDGYETKHHRGQPLSPLNVALHSISNNSKPETGVLVLCPGWNDEEMSENSVGVL